MVVLQPRRAAQGVAGLIWMPSAVSKQEGGKVGGKRIVVSLSLSPALPHDAFWKRLTLS